MRTRLVVFPVKGRNWCFSRSIDPSLEDTTSTHTHSTLKDLWKNISFSSNSSAQNVKLFIDYASNKMNKAWTGLEKAPEGTFKSKLHGLGLMLLSRIKPSEIFLKSISKGVTCAEITYPSSLNGHLVRRRLRHIASRSCLCPTSHSFGSYSEVIPTGELLSEKLLQLVSDCSYAGNSVVPIAEGSNPESEESKHKFHNSQYSLWVLQPSKEFEELHNKHADENGLNDSGISEICKNCSLNTKDVSKFRWSM